MTLHSDWQGEGSGLIDISGNVYSSFTAAGDFPNGMYSVGAAGSHYDASSRQQIIDTQHCYKLVCISPNQIVESGR